MHSFFKYIILMLLISSCIDEYTPLVEDKYVDLLVVDGKLSNENGPHSVILKKARSINNTIKDEPVKGAQVKIVDKSGGEVLLTETEDGTYQTGIDYRGEEGNSYKLVIEVNISGTNEIYESEYEELKKSPEIDEIYYKYKQKVHKDNSIENGLEFYVKTADPTNSTRYYSWEVTEAWKFHSKYYIPKFVDSFYCYKNNFIESILIGTTEQLKEDKLDIPVFYVSDQSDRFLSKYGVEVKQLSISQKSYYFKKNIRELKEQGGGLYDKIPYSIYGNINCVSNPEKNALGNFQVSGVSVKKLFLKWTDIGKLNLSPRQPECAFSYKHILMETLKPLIEVQASIDNLEKQLLEDTTLEIYQIVAIMDSISFLNDTVDIILEEEGYYYIGDDDQGYKWTKEYCVNCTFFGTLEPPDFWEE